MSVFYRWRDLESKKTGRSRIAGIEKMLRQGRKITVLKPRPASAAQRVVNAAKSQVGIKEVPRNSNRGPNVQKYQRSTTLAGTGWPWCQAFVRWVWDQAGVHKNGYRGAYVPYFEAWAKAAGKWSSKPALGAAAVFDWNRDGVADHVGIVVSVSPLVTIEGNTSPGAGGNQSDGDGVYRRVDRKAAQVRGYVHI